VTQEAYRKWYIDVHIPEVIANEPFTLTGATLYTTPPTDDSKTNWMALYYGKDFGILNPNNNNIHHKDIGLAGNTGSPRSVAEIADLDIRTYELILDYDPNNVGQGPFPLLVFVSLRPAEGTDDDFNTWYKEEHLGLLAKVPGYKRSRRYKKGGPLAEGQDYPEYVAIHEFDGPESLTTPENAAASATEWAKKTLGEAQVFDVQVVGLVKDFEGNK